MRESKCIDCQPQLFNNSTETKRLMQNVNQASLAQGESLEHIMSNPDPCSKVAFDQHPWSGDQ